MHESKPQNKDHILLTVGLFIGVSVGFFWTSSIKALYLNVR